MELSRRQFMIGCSAAIAAMAGARISNLAFAQAGDTTARDLLVVVFLRGGCDGLSLVAPVNDADYVENRGDIRILDSGANAGLQLGNGLAGLDFRLHAKGGPLKELYDSKSLAIVHACGLTNGTRSHFEAQDYMDRGTASDGSIGTGWLARHLGSISSPGPIPVLASSSTTPDSLLGDSRSVALTDAAGFRLNGSQKYAKQQQAALYTLYEGSTAIHVAGQGTLDTISKIDSSIPKDNNGNPKPYQTENGAKYDGGLGNAFKTIAQIAKMDVGLQIATIDYGGWDTHENQFFPFQSQVDNLSRGLSAFYNDMVRYYNKLTVVVMSEFGRRVKANKSGGTDHGHGNVMLVMGGYVNGGKMYGQWPGLNVEQLDNHVDLAITTDYRTVLSEILTTRAGNPAIDQVFPGYTGFQPLGLLRSDGTPNDPPKGSTVDPSTQTNKIYLPVVRN